jgi:hypothetical protein
MRRFVTGNDLVTELRVNSAFLCVLLSKTRWQTNAYFTDVKQLTFHCSNLQISLVFRSKTGGLSNQTFFSSHKKETVSKIYFGTVSYCDVTSMLRLG